jgi:diaminopimelate epimerase
MKTSGNGIPFVKATASGNDFILIEGMYAPADLAACSRRLCDRHEGVGADGVEWLFPDSHKEADVHARLFNADGSEAEISGNGTRCVAAYLVAERGGEVALVRTGAGVKQCLLKARDGNHFTFETDMGEPQVGDEFSIKLAFGEVRGTPVSMGNPHFVVFVPGFSPGWQAEAAEMGRHHDFKYGINVELVSITNKNRINVRFYERGVGETRSSGTGSCAAAVAAIVQGKCESPVEVVAPGGAQSVSWPKNVMLTGTAQLLFQGDCFL